MMESINELPLYQFKLSNGDEVIACVIEWADDKDVAVKFALKMVDVDNPNPTTEYSRTFLFRPWMAYQEDLDATVYINPNNIVSYFVPSTDMRAAYLTSVGEVKEFYAESNTMIKTGGMREREEEEILEKKDNVLSIFTKRDETEE